MLFRPDLPLVSLHVPKTAGTSLRSALHRWFPGGRLKLHYQDTTTLERPPEFEFSGPICIHGHFDATAGIGVDQYYPQARQYIGFFREPFDRAVSLYCFMHSGRHPRRSTLLRLLPAIKRRKVVESPDLMPFDSWISFMRDEEAAGRGSATRLYLPAAQSFEALKQDLAKRFVFVGLTENYDRSLLALGSTLGKTAERVRHVNQTQRPRIDFGKWRAMHEKAFPSEYELYETTARLNGECLRRVDMKPSGGARGPSVSVPGIKRLASSIERDLPGLSN